MSQNQKTRSTLSIDAVAQAAAEGAVDALSPTGKIQAISALAGFVLRLFRRKVSGPERKNRVTTEVKPVYDRCVVKPRRKAVPASALEKGGTDHGQG